MRAYRVTLKDLPKIAKWVREGRFVDFSFACWTAWNLRLDERLKCDDVHVFVLEDDKGEIKVLIYAEVRDAVKNKLDVDTATNCVFLMREDAIKEDYQTLLKWILEYAYTIKCYRADFWNLKVHASWIKELCGDYARFVGEHETLIGSAIRIVIDIKGLVESWLSSQ
jgi:hypothetical protein